MKQIPELEALVRPRGEVRRRRVGPCRAGRQRSLGPLAAFDRGVEVVSGETVFVEYAPYLFIPAPTRLGSRVVDERARVAPRANDDHGASGTQLCLEALEVEGLGARAF